MNIGFYFCYVLQGLSARSQWAWAAAQTPKTPHDVWCHCHHPVVAGNAGSSFLWLMSGKTLRPNVTRGLKVSDAARNAAKNIFLMDLRLIKWGRASKAEISADISQYTNYPECVPELFKSPFKLKEMTHLCQFSFSLLFKFHSHHLDALIWRPTKWFQTRPASLLQHSDILILPQRYESESGREIYYKIYYGTY